MRRPPKTLLMLFLLSCGPLAADAEVVSELQRTVPLSAAPLDLAVSPDGQRTYVLLRGGTVEVRDGGGGLLGTVQVDADVTAIATSGDGSGLYAVNGSGRTLEIRSVDLIHQIDTAGAPFQGPRDAPVTVAVYNDFQ